MDVEVTFHLLLHLDLEGFSLQGTPFSNQTH